MSEAVISLCGMYRYRLERRFIWPGQTVAVIMVNPSTADATQDDATIRKLKGFADRHQWGRLVVGNLFAFRSKDVGDLARVPDPVGADNDAYLSQIMVEADKVIVAWGPVAKQPKALRSRWRAIVSMADVLGKPLFSIGEPARDGHPKHPLMLPYTNPLTPWNGPKPPA